MSLAENISAWSATVFWPYDKYDLWSIWYGPYLNSTWDTGNMRRIAIPSTGLPEKNQFCDNLFIRHKNMVRWCEIIILDSTVETMIYDNYKFGVIFLLNRKRICQFNCYPALPPTVFYIQSFATLRIKMRENAFLLGLVLCSWSFDIADTQGVSVDLYCNKNDLELPQHAKRWHCSNPLATDHSKIPIGDKCDLICKDNYRLYKSNC